MKQIDHKGLTGSALAKIEAILAYHFARPELLEQAFTHTSYANEAYGDPGRGNERLEFLGDAVLELVSSRWLFDLSDESEGVMSRKRAHLVCEASLSEIALRNHLGQFLLLSKGTEKMGGRNRTSILEDLVESIFGAVYLDGGLEAASELIIRLVLEPQKEAVLHADTQESRNQLHFHDYKTELQELMQSRPGANFEYRLEKETGPSHNPVFEVSLWCSGVLRGRGSGHSKKEAEQKAAAMALQDRENL